MEGKTANYFTIPGQITTLPGNGKTVSSNKGKNISPFCDDCRSVMKDEPNTEKTFQDGFGDRWRCYRPLHCEHAIVMHGCMYSCRVRTSEVRAMKIMMGLE